MENLRSSNNKTGKRKWKFSKFVPILAGALFLANPDWAIAQNAPNQNRTQAEISNSTILDRLNQKIWVSLPDEYNQKVLEFVLNDTIMKTRSATNYTEKFIINEMKKDWWISKQNQLLFIRSSIYGWITKVFLYDRLDDDNDIRSIEYEKALDLINASYEEYKRWFNIYMETWITNAQQRSADAQQRSADAQQRSVETTLSWLHELIRFYNLYKENPQNITNNEIEQTIQDSKFIINSCKELWIDYREIISKEAWNEDTINEILRFYGI